MGEPTAPPPPPAFFDWRRWLASGRARHVSIIAAIVFTGSMLLPDPGLLPRLRYESFDAYQTLLPRERTSAPAVIVAIDDISLARVGQWPWPRDTVAKLIDKIAERKPAVIGVDILFAEVDRTSPERVAESVRSRDPQLADRLARLASNETILAESFSRVPVVLGVAGIDHARPRRPIVAPFRAVGAEPTLRAFAGALTSRPEVDQAAAGHGLLNADPERGVVRRVPLVAAIAGEPILTLSLECLRVASGAALFTLRSDERGLREIAIGDIAVPTQPDGTLWVHYSRHDGARYVSAADVLEGRDLPGVLQGKVALLGVTGIGLLDQRTTARGEVMPGIEIHAQIVENVFDNALLSRPRWATWVEAMAFALAALVIIIGVPRIPPRRSLFLPLACWCMLEAGGIGAYGWGRVLLDPWTPIMGINVLYLFALSATLVASDLLRRELAARLEAEREVAARVAGELEAARRIQTAMLPKPDVVLEHEHRIEMFAHMHPAREVGGDLYDFFPLPGDKLFILVGDVAGKGLPAAMFMAVSKALAKSTTLRATAGLDALLTTLNAEISRENPDELFVTAVAVVIDLRTGETEYCNAGHEPLLLVRRSGAVEVYREGGGPPLCAVDEFPYRHARFKFESGDVLVLMSDGITEAMNPAQELYGRERLLAWFDEPAQRAAHVNEIGRELIARVGEYEAGAEPSDDQTLLLVRWQSAAALG